MADLVQGTGKGARRGVTLIEAVLFISVALGLIVGGLVFYQQAALAARTNAFIRQLAALVVETRVLYRGIGISDTFDESDLLSSGIDGGVRIDDVLVAMGAVPSDTIVPVRGSTALMPGSRLIHPWGGELSVMVGGLQTYSGGNMLQITALALPRAACMRLVPITDRSVLFADRVFTLNTMTMRPSTPGYSGSGYNFGTNYTWLARTQGPHLRPDRAASLYCRQNNPDDVFMLSWRIEM